MIWKHNLFSFSVLEYNVLYLVEKSGNLKLARKLQKEKPEAILYLSVTSLGYLKAFLELYGQIWLNLVWKAESDSWLIMNQKKITGDFRSREKINYNGKLFLSCRKGECLAAVIFVSLRVAVRIVLLLHHEGIRVSIGNLLKISEFWSEEALDPNPSIWLQSPTFAFKDLLWVPYFPNIG